MDNSRKSSFEDPASKKSKLDIKDAEDSSKDQSQNHKKYRPIKDTQQYISTSDHLRNLAQKEDVHIFGLSKLSSVHEVPSTPSSSEEYPTHKISEFFSRMEPYQKYQSNYKTHEGLATTRIKELRTWQDCMKEEQKQEIENFITTIEQGFQAIKRDPLDIEADITTPIGQATEEYNRQLTEASQRLSDFSTLVTDFSSKFIDKLKLTQVKGLPMDILKSEIERLDPQASVWGDSTAQELHKFLQQLKTISKYTDNHSNTQDNKEILKLYDNISENYFNEISHKTIRDTLRRIEFPLDNPVRQVEKDRITHILNKLKKLEEGVNVKKIKVIATGIQGLSQLSRLVTSHTDGTRYQELGTLTRELSAQIISHNPTNTWPDNIIANLQKIQSELNKKRNNNNQLIQSLQNQIEAFSNEFIEQRRQQK